MEGAPFTVLIADDEATIRNGLREVIPWKLYHTEVIDTASDGLSALASIRHTRPDIVIIDIKMPNMDGLEVIRQAREEGIMSRFIILSGYDDFCFAQKAIRLGAKAYFLKPLHVQEFRDELSRQVTELMAERNINACSDQTNTLLQTSRLFLLNQLVTNELHCQQDLNRRATMLGLRLEVDQPCCCAVFVALTQDSEKRREALSQLTCFLSSLSADQPCEVWMRSDQYAVILSQIQPGTVPRQDKLHVVLDRVQQECGIRCAAGVGSVVPALIHASQSFSTALRASTYALYGLPEDVYDSSIICIQTPPNTAQRDQVLFTALMQAVETRSCSQLKQLVEEAINTLFFVPYPPPDYVRGRCTALLSSICAQMNTNHPDEGPFTPPVTDAARQKFTIDDLTSWVQETLLNYSRQYQQARQQADPLVEAAKTYILEHLSENIKANDVAARINLSTSYFTTYFKQKAGCNFRDYVLEQKMKYAKELLQKQAMNVEQVAYATGYTAYRSFSRAFKNVTNHLPSDYQHPGKEET